MINARIDILRACIWLLLVFPPLLLGANRPLFWAMNGLLVAIALAALALREFHDPRVARDRLAVAVAALLAVGAFWMALQSVSFMPQGWHHPIWQLTPQSPSAISLHPAAGWAALGWWLSLAIFFPAMRAGASSPHAIRRALATLAVMGAIIGAFGILVEQLGLATLGIAPKQAYVGWVTGTFVSRNTAAAYFVMSLICAIALLTASPGSLAPRARVQAALCAVIILPALLLTGSRAGIVSGLAGLGLLAFMRLRHERKSGWKAVAAITAGAAVCVMLAGSALLARAGDSIGSNVSRFSLYQESIAAIADRPWLGHGAGAFASVQPLYHRADTSSEYIWQHAHSLYLEAAVTLGLPVAAILVIGFAGVWIALMKRRRGHAGLAAEAALAAGLALCLHAAVDFVLQTQAIALALAILSGLAVAETVSHSRHKRRNQPDEPAPVPGASTSASGASGAGAAGSVTAAGGAGRDGTVAAVATSTAI